MQKLLFLVRRILSLPREQRKIILLLLDAFLIFISLFLSTKLSFESNVYIDNEKFKYLITIGLGLFLYSFTGQYRSLIFYFGISSLYSIILRNLLLIFVVNISFKFLNILFFTKSSLLLFFCFITFFVLLVRLILRDIFRYSNRLSNYNFKSAVIYGAGETGAQLEAGLRLGGKYNIKAFVDESPKLWGRYLNGIRIYPTDYFKKNNQIDEILIAIPSLTNEQIRLIFSDLEKFKIPILLVPSIKELTEGNSSIENLKRIDINDLLSRDIVQPKSELLSTAIKDFVVCVTGAGGSIGSELCFQILKLNPIKLIVIDNSEFNLYSLKEQFSQFKNIDIKSFLGDINNSNFLKNIFSKENVDIIFHAAAYKHVPLVESNPISGILNNVFTTKILCEISILFKIKKFILISSDKAVRPSNVMGATKRLAELVIQAYAKDIEESPKNYSFPTKFAMVRFGNVLDSSGSVVPLFKKQIAAGGPITITHPRIIRYFMTIKEASQLVIQASAMTKGGDVFLLDMGKPVSILELAKQIIRLSGHSIKDINNPNGDIEIINIGLRPGEKLYEELLINADALPTQHPLIFRAKERLIYKDELLKELEKLKANIDENKSITETFEILKRLVPEWLSTNENSN